MFAVAPNVSGAWSRRRFLRNAAVSSGLLALAVDTAPVRAAASPVILVWRPWYNFPNGTGSTAIALMHKGIEPWLAKNPGVRVTVSTMGYQGATIAALLAGTGPDVFADWVLGPYVEGNLLMDVAPYVRRDNVNLDIFPSGEMAYFSEIASFASPGALYTMPSYIHTDVYAVNEGLLDQIGLKYPQPEWTYLDWTHMWEAAAVRSATPSKNRYGGSLFWSGYDSSGGNPAPCYLHGFGGGYVDPANPLRSTLDSPGSLQCLEWVYSLIDSNAVGFNDIAAGNIVSCPRGTAGGLPYAAETYPQLGLKWNLYPSPTFPKGRFIFGPTDFYAVAAGTKYPEQAWSLMKYLCTQSYWQLWMVKIALNGPNPHHYPHLDPRVLWWRQPPRCCAPQPL